MALDGELFYSTHDRDEIISILHSKNIKIMSVLSYDMAMPDSSGEYYLSQKFTQGTHIAGTREVDGLLTPVLPMDGYS